MRDETRGRWGPGAAHVAGWVVIFMTTVRPEEATSNLAAWFKFFGGGEVPQFLASGDADAFALGAGVILVVGTMSYWFFWRRRQALWGWIEGVAGPLGRNVKMLLAICMIAAGMVLAVFGGILLQQSLSPPKTEAQAPPLPSDMLSTTAPTEAQRQAPVSVTIVHGGVNFFLSPDLAPGLTRSATDAAKATESPEPRSLIQAAEYMLFAAEADGNQPPLAVNEWTRIYFHTELRDSDFGYDEQSSVYTNEKTSLHQFDVSVNFAVLDEKADEYRLRLVTSNRIYEDRLTSSVLASRLPFRATVLSNMDAADTAYYEVMQIGGTASTVIKAGSYFMGRRLGGKL